MTQITTQMSRHTEMWWQYVVDDAIFNPLREGISRSFRALYLPPRAGATTAIIIALVKRNEPLYNVTVWFRQSRIRESFRQKLLEHGARFTPTLCLVSEMTDLTGVSSTAINIMDNNQWIGLNEQQKRIMANAKRFFIVVADDFDSLIQLGIGPRVTYFDRRESDPSSDLSDVTQVVAQRPQQLRRLEPPRWNPTGSARLIERLLSDPIELSPVPPLRESTITDNDSTLDSFIAQQFDANLIITHHAFDQIDQ